MQESLQAIAKSSKITVKRLHPII